MARDLKKFEKFGKIFFAGVIDSLQQIDLGNLQKIAELLIAAKDRGANIFFFGNGGSHSIASHMACDFGKGTKVEGRRDQKYYKAFGLDNPAWLTAQANDGEAPFLAGGHPGSYKHGYDGIFVGQMENFLEPGDVAFGISSSGNSANVVNGLLYAKSRQCVTVALVGFDGGQAARVADHVLLVQTAKGEYGIVESVHECIHHYLYEYARLSERDT